MPADAPLLQLRNITRLFPGVRALDGVDFTLRRGEIHALMGENGAGKSTLMKVLTGVHPPTTGTITLDGHAITPTSTRDAQALGISTVYQEVNLVPGLSVAENLFLGRQPRRFGFIDWRAMRAGAHRALARLDMTLDVSRPLADYSLAIQQMVAIARAVDLSAKVLVLDEPTSSLDAGEVRRLFDAMRRLKAQGLGIVFITHFLEQVYEVADRITVLRNGKLVGEYATAQLPRVALIERMIGRSLAAASGRAARPPIAPTPPEPWLSARGLARRGSIEPFDLEVRPGEVVGLAGLLGSGRTEIARLLFGIDAADAGRISVAGREVRLSGPRRAVALGMAFCPEDRKAAGIIPDLSVRENIVLALQARRGWLRPLSRRQQDELAERSIASLRIATSDAEKPIRLLSGGNQQKAILARWLLTEPRLLILDEPTRGIDIGAKEEVAALVESLRRQGLAVILICSELEEMVASNDRVLVLRDRRVVGELAGAAVTEPAIMAAIAG